MENTMEIMVNENQEVIEEAAVEVAKKLDIKEIAKKGGKVVIVAGVAYGLYKGITKGVPALTKGAKKLRNKWTKKDVMVDTNSAVDVDDYTEVDDFEKDEI